MTVKRYDSQKYMAGMFVIAEKDDGKFVRYDDYAALKAERDELKKQVVCLAVENVSLKSNLMFWDADNPELSYDSPEEIASECELTYNDEFVVQVASKLPNRTYRVRESWEYDCKIELVDGVEIATPATDAALANIQAQGVERFAEHLLCPDLDESIRAFAVELRKGASND